MRRALALSTLTVLLAACTQAVLPTQLEDRQVNLGNAVSQRVTQEFLGSWQIKDVSPWLSVNTYSGTGNVVVNISARRSDQTALLADQPQLNGHITIEWTGVDGTTSGVSTWTVSADQYRLSGQVVDTARIDAADIQARANGLLTAQRVGPSSRGILVTYRTAALRDQALKAEAGLSAQNLNSSSARLRALGVGERQRQPLAARAARLDLAATESNLHALRADPNVQSAVPNRVLHALSTGALAAPVVPTDQYAALQWAYPLLGYGAVWRDMESGAYRIPVTVAVLDSGVRFDHPDLSGKLYGKAQGALDLVNPLGDASDPGTLEGGRRGTHGTHVTGIIVANWGTNPTPTCAGCSTSGVVGASYRAPIKVLPVRVIGPDGTDVSTVTTAVLYAAGLPVTVNGQTMTNPHPAQVINLSLGGSGVSAAEAAPMCDAIAQARARGILTFAAAGNDGTTDPYYPAACPDAVAVGSVTLSGGSAPENAWYSNFYPKVELSAPGGDGRPINSFNGGLLNGQKFPDDIISTGWNYDKNEPAYDVLAGTSQATPQASALAALLLSKGVTTGANDTLARMTATATDLGGAGRDDHFGYGMINPAAALSAPAVSDSLGLRLQDALGHVYQPPLNAQGQFTAYLGDGTYQVIGGRDRNGNGIYGEVNEPKDARTVTLGPSQPGVNVGPLRPQ